MSGGSGSSVLGRQRFTGSGAAAFKYDVLTALLVLAAQGDPIEARLAMRLSLLITARFNWRSETFAVGLRELARMWGVTERTAKRDMAAMRGRRWIEVHVPAARGRVATYRILMPDVLRATMPYWEAVGPDFAARMVGAPQPDEASNVIPLRMTDVTMPATDAYGWSQAAATLHLQDKAVFNAWFASLEEFDFEGGVLTLSAPSRFHADYVRTHFLSRILAAVVAANKGIREVNIQSKV